MKTKITLLFLVLFGITTRVYSQITPSADTAKKDTTIGQKLGKALKTVGNYVLPAQEPDEDMVCYSDRCVFEEKMARGNYSVGQFVHESFLFLGAPLRWHKKDFLTAGVILGGTLAIMPLDEPLNKLSQGNQHYYYSAPVVGGRIYGEWYSIGGVTALFAGYGIIAHNNTAKKMSIELLQAGLYAEAITEVLKVCTGRARPLENVGAFTFHPFNIHNVYESMPSGHACSAFALSTVMFRHAHTTFWKVMSFVPAAFTVFSRFYQDFHWPSDLFFGAATGFTTGMWVVNLHEGRRHKINIPSDNK
jgi:membrane-associated phospholipid phosphatase